ncbi:YkvA family protein [Thermosulfuriphilus sp.]
MHPKERLKEIIRLLPRFLALIVSLMRDPRVSKADKAILGATVVYLLNPVDLIPDAIPFVGLVDDIYLVALALLRLLNRTDESVLREHWQGEPDIIPLVKKAADLAVWFLPSRVRQALLAKIEVT